MPHFFIERPIFAWVIALFIVLTGLLSIPRLPVAQYPEVAPPGIIISVSYPGASPEVMNTSVVSLIEREISSVDNLLYFESSSDTTGMASITVTFKPGTDIKLAQWICPYISRHLYHLTHYWPAAADIPVASDNPAHYADAIRYNARTPLQGSLLPLTRLVWA